VASRRTRPATEKKRDVAVKKAFTLLKTELVAAEAIYMFTKDPKDKDIYNSVKKRYDELVEKPVDDLSEMFSKRLGGEAKKSKAKK
jgi:hypothetical protein